MATTTDFDTWLEENVDGTDYNDVYSIFQAVNNLTDMGGFEVKKNSNGRIFVSNGLSDETLMISSDAAKETFLKMIEDKYCEDMDIEGYYTFHRAMERDD